VRLWNGQHLQKLQYHRFQLVPIELLHLPDATKFYTLTNILTVITQHL
jgi:hypothetical protein